MLAAFFIFYSLVSVVLGAPLSPRSNVALPKTTQTSQVHYYHQNGAQGACSWWSSDDDLVVGLPLSIYSGVDGISPYCGSFIDIIRPDSSSSKKPLRAKVADASAGDRLLLSVATFEALGGFQNDLESVDWKFVPAGSPTPAKSASPSPTPVPSPPTSSSQVQDPPAATASLAPSPPPPAAAPIQHSTAGQYWGDATFFYQQGQAGACGNVHSDDDMLIALDTSMYDGGSHCGEKVKIFSSSGSSVDAIVADECPTCSSPSSIDLSVATFKSLGDESEGVLKISWSFI